jgi:ubiquinone biosynthesis protein UbiJ
LYTRQPLSGLTHVVHTMASDKKRVQFRAPHRLIDRADALATVLGEDRTDVLVTALREYLRDAAQDDALTQEIAAAYYDDEISYDELRALVGAEEAANFRVLKQQLNEDYVDDVAEL